MKQGIYEHVINQETNRRMQEAEQSGLVCVQQPIDDAESPQMLANYLANAIRQKLEDTEEQQDRVNLINRIMVDAGLLDDKQIVKPADLLAEVMTQQQSALQNQSNTQTIRPISGFRVSNLFTGGSSTLSLGEEIRREIASADEICFIVSFLKVSGVRILLDDLKRFCSREGTRLRIITTTYCGATQAKAIEQLAALPNTEIRISYNTDIERLHAKSYIFVRNSGMNTAYIGSSNLSKSAQTEGLEWNMRVTSVENPHIIKTALATFEMYWNSPNFEDFRIGGIEKFNKEIHRNRSHAEATDFVYQRYTLLPHQKQILDKLRVEREDRGNYKNLIVAATGTGKTVISAFDYQEFARTHSRARILFTAHREEILRQSLNTYRSVLQDANFGTLWVGANRPQEASEYEHLFVSISMFNSRFEELFVLLDSDFYDYIVIDEAHHSQADSYRKLFDHFQPQLLVGLTATPERMDGKDLRPDFGNRISAEIRLPQALQAGLLTPFQYLCISDDTDLSDDSLWSGQKYNIERLADKLCAKTRAQLIVDALHKYLADEYTCQALCFCVNKRHADFMAEQYKTYAIMLYYALFQDKLSKTGYNSINEALELIHLPKYNCFKQEIAEVISHLLANLEIRTTPIEKGVIAGLELYGCYTREEIFTLVGRQTADVRMQGAASGAFNLPEHNTVLLFVTLNKSEKDFSPSTQYNDYLINGNYFHWQSKNTDSHNNSGGRKYVEQSKTGLNVILFVREEKKDGFGNTSPFHCFGLVDYVSSHDDFPMNVKWKLHKPAMAKYLKAI